MKVWADHMVDHFSTYIYQKRGFYYFSRRVPKDVQPLHDKQRIKANASSCFAFPRYTDNARYKANSASAALNKWLHAHLRKDIVSPQLPPLNA